MEQAMYVVFLQVPSFLEHLMNIDNLETLKLID